MGNWIRSNPMYDSWKKAKDMKILDTVVENKTMEVGTKKDEGKVRLDLIPPEVIFAMGDILTFGSRKYSDRDWEKGMSWGRVYGALMRHLWSWWAGKTATKSFLFDDLDGETNKSHLWHAACCIAFLVTYEERGIGKDDRK